MKQEHIKKNKGGYTIIETMIAISLFIIIVMLGMGALLNANLLSQKSKDMRSIIDNLSFVMEDMSRSLRTGYDYHCITDINNLNNIGVGASGTDCTGIAFKPQGYSDTNNNLWVYEAVNDGTIYYIRKSTDNGVTWVQMTPNEVKIDSATPFTVSGAELRPGDTLQPFVTIKLSGKIIIPGKNVESPFSLQTSVSQRAIDF